MRVAYWLALQGATTSFGQLARLFADRTSKLLSILYTLQIRTPYVEATSVRNETFAATPSVTCTVLPAVGLLKRIIITQCVVYCSMLIIEFQFELHVSTVFPAVSTPHGTHTHLQYLHSSAHSGMPIFCTCNRMLCYVQVGDWICADITVWNCRQ
jgi:hypothetical protein